MYKRYDDLPLIMSVQEVAEVLGISKSGAYVLMKEKGFPKLKIGARVVVPRDKFIEWIGFSRPTKIPANEVKTRLIAGIVSCRCSQKRLIYAKNRTQELYHFLSPEMAGAEGLEEMKGNLKVRFYL